MLLYPNKNSLNSDRPLSWKESCGSLGPCMRRRLKATDRIPAYFLVTQSLESLTERCEGALHLLGEALQSMEAEPMPDNIKVHNMWFEYRDSQTNAN